MKQFKKRRKRYIDNNKKDLKSKIEILERAIKTRQKDNEDVTDLMLRLKDLKSIVATKNLFTE